MAIEFKYGKITLENGNIPDDEPVIVFRAQDMMVPYVLDAYYALCEVGGSPVEHLERIQDTQYRFIEWQNANETKVPD